ncbi:acetate kinase [Intrasporangium calvum]|uniref:Acetate kinase n=1 Tax=Intrasporangium calvum TaxID=53358 RepID=A0ABT5GF32_9MICO|nr:acetate kinase [Intrasporangium calvum]MDC5696495.1 acetate kinase [Intrasporangium calvum]
MSRLVLVVNAGSSSLKYDLIDVDAGESLASGIVERIGEATSRAKHSVGGAHHRTEGECADHGAAFDLLLGAFHQHGPDLAGLELTAVGHRVVHGGAQFSAPTLIDDEVEATIERLVPLAPLHNPANLEGIRVARAHFPAVPQVAVFDTAFHQTLPPHAYTYAVSRQWRDEHRVRRYGFHGTSHAYVSRRAAELLELPVETANVIVLHLGNGASATAVAGGRSVDTSMGLSPLEGLVMGTRPGDLDPSLPAHLARAGVSLEEYDRALNKESGLKGLTGSNDFRELEEQVVAGDGDARLAFDVVAHRLRKYIGAYAAVLGRVDAVAFTAGVGEHSPMLRRACLDGLDDLLGIEVDAAANDAAMSGEHRISTASSRVAVLVIPTEEELEIAREAAGVAAGA